MAAEDPLHAEGAAERPLRVVLVSDGSTEDHEDGVPDELLDRPVVAERLLGEVLEDARDEDLELLGIEVVGERREPDEVGEQHRDEPALLVLHTSKYRARVFGRARGGAKSAKRRREPRRGSLFRQPVCKTSLVT